jgi:hypothetical protein
VALVNYKTVFKADFKPRLSYYERMFPAASSLSGYKDWITTGMAINLNDFEAWTSCSLSHESILYIRDIKEEATAGQDDRRIREIIAKVPAALDLHEFKRIGLRSWYLHSVKMTFKNLVSLISDKFLVQNNEIREGICPIPSDVAYMVDFVDNGFLAKLRVGPVKRDELENQFQPNRNANLPVKLRTLPPEELFADFPETSVLIDLDVSRKDVALGDLEGMYSESQKVHATLSQNIINYVLGREEKGKER